ncbi:MAG: hypothetical protein J6125_02980, partial [Clostridia bacterium]|nr:hypothetical protein [Clostridia bacterium]
MIDPLLWIWLAQACSPGSDAWGILRDAGHTPLSLRAAGREELTALIPRRRALIERLLDRDTTAA